MPVQYRADAHRRRTVRAPRTIATAPGPAPRPPARGRPARRRPKHRVGAEPMRLPVRILLWVVAFVVGGGRGALPRQGHRFRRRGHVLRPADRQQLGDLPAAVRTRAAVGAVRHRVGDRVHRRSARLGPADVRRVGVAVRRRRAAARRPKVPASTPAAGAKAAGAAAGAAAAGTPRARERSIPRREPAPVAVPGPKPPSSRSDLPSPPPVAPAVNRTSTMPLAGASHGGAAATAGTHGDATDDPAADFTARATAGQRPRRIPRRGAGS